MNHYNFSNTKSGHFNLSGRFFYAIFHKLTCNEKCNLHILKKVMNITMKIVEESGGMWYIIN